MFGLSGPNFLLVHPVGRFRDRGGEFLKLALRVRENLESLGGREVLRPRRFGFSCCLLRADGRVDYLGCRSREAADGSLSS